MVMEEKCCRLCLGDEGDGSLVQPCACRGTAMWIHGHCLEYWRRTSPKEDAAYRCGQCMDEYRDALSLELLSARLQAERAGGEDTSLTSDRLALELQFQGKYDEAEPLYREVLEVRRTMLGNRHDDTLGSINNLGLLLQYKGEYAAAEPLQREALEVTREKYGSRHQGTLRSVSCLGLLLRAKGDLAAAEPLFREALEVARETLGGRHTSTLACIGNLGRLLEDKGDLAAAEPLYREALEGQRPNFGNRHPHTLTAIDNLALLLWNKGDLAAAEPLSRGALEVWRQTLGDRHSETLMAISNLGHMLLVVKGDLAAAEPLLREALAGQRETLGGQHPKTLKSLSLDALLRSKMKAKMEAETKVRQHGQTLVILSHLRDCAESPFGLHCSSRRSTALAGASIPRVFYIQANWAFVLIMLKLLAHTFLRTAACILLVECASFCSPHTSSSGTSARARPAPPGMARLAALLAWSQWACEVRRAARRDGVT